MVLARHQVADEVAAHGGRQAEGQRHLRGQLWPQHSEHQGHGRDGAPCNEVAGLEGGSGLCGVGVWGVDGGQRVVRELSAPIKGSRLTGNERLVEWWGAR